MTFKIRDNRSENQRGIENRLEISFDFTREVAQINKKDVKRRIRVFHDAGKDALSPLTGYLGEVENLKYIPEEAKYKGGRRTVKIWQHSFFSPGLKLDVTIEHCGGPDRSIKDLFDVEAFQNYALTGEYSQDSP